MKWFAGYFSIDEIKKRYRDLALRWHPDRNSDPNATEIMKEINAEYEIAMAFATKQNTDYKYSNYTQEQLFDEMLIFKDIILELLTYDGLVIEIIGSWIWVTGNTYYYRKELQELGFKWAPVKKAWAYHEGEWYRRKRRPKSLDELRQKYGSKKVNPFNNKYLNDIIVQYSYRNYYI